MTTEQRSTEQPHSQAPGQASEQTSGQAFGIDIGGTGIKGAVVDVRTGELLTERARIPTPQPATPDAVAAVVHDLLAQHRWQGAVGATFPAAIVRGVARSAANVDPSWIGTDVAAVLGAAAGRNVQVLNDADAAGIAEARFGAAKDVPGVVIVLTFGTGIGSAILLDGALVPNTELGHLEFGGKQAEQRAAASVRERKKLSFAEWAARVSAYLGYLEELFSPELFVVGGGVSKEAARWVPKLELNTPVRPAVLRNNAGIVGAALSATAALAHRQPG